MWKKLSKHEKKKLWFCFQFIESAGIILYIQWLSHYPFSVCSACARFSFPDILWDSIIELLAVVKRTTSYFLASNFKFYYIVCVFFQFFLYINLCVSTLIHAQQLIVRLSDLAFYSLWNSNNFFLFAIILFWIKNNVILNLWRKFLTENSRGIRKYFELNCFR
jgi:hypothetical protein